MSDLFEATYNPDVLSCLANLSNDEVFTPPEIANEMLDLLPKEIWSDSSATFLDPATKSGVFLREIAKRLIDGLEEDFPDLEERLDHIYKKQLFGIATTELCSLLARRSTYCSKYPTCQYSIVRFDDDQPMGNIRYKQCEHDWYAGRCKHCGASQRELDRDDEREAYAYEFIHTDRPEEILPMKFDVIIGNPPYQLNDGGNGASASPIYQKFVEQAMKLNPRYLTMITPSRWLAGGKGLDKFRNEMLNNNHLRIMVDYINAKDCFPENSVGGGVNYFLWDRDNPGDCAITTVLGQSRDTQIRPLNEFEVFVRYNKAVEVIRRIQAKNYQSLATIVSSRNPFGLPTKERGHANHEKGDLALISSKGRSWIARNDVEPNKYIDKYKVMISRITYEHAGEPDKDGMLRILSKVEILKPGEVCTDSYLVIGPFNTEDEANNCIAYLKTRVARFLVSQTLTSINLNKDRFCFVPKLDMSISRTEQELYKEFDINEEEREFIESLIRTIEVDNV